MSTVDSDAALEKPEWGSRLLAIVMRLQIATVVRDSRFARSLRRNVWDPFYGGVAREFLPMGIVNFLNLGYVADLDDSSVGENADIADRLSERLYDQLVGDVDLDGRVVVEVGCGPGGGSAYLARTRHAASFTGIDLNVDMIAWCKAHHEAPNLQFLQGDAQDLPIESSSVDAVVNLESAHCYPSRLQFFEEVVRVLRPGGSFMFADFIFAAGQSADGVSDELTKAGLIIGDRIDITDNVVAARDMISRTPAFWSRVAESVPSRRMAETAEHMFLTDSGPYKRLVSRKVRYVQWRASKPSEDPAPAK